MKTGESGHSSPAGLELELDDRGPLLGQGAVLRGDMRAFNAENLPIAGVVRQAILGISP